jgi:hypothetical protein
LAEPGRFQPGPAPLCNGSTIQIFKRHALLTYNSYSINLPAHALAVVLGSQDPSCHSLRQRYYRAYCFQRYEGCANSAFPVSFSSARLADLTWRLASAFPPTHAERKANASTSAPAGLCRPLMDAGRYGVCVLSNLYTRRGGAMHISGLLASRRVICAHSIERTRTRTDAEVVRYLVAGSHYGLLCMQHWQYRCRFGISLSRKRGLGAPWDTCWCRTGDLPCGLRVRRAGYPPIMQGESPMLHVSGETASYRFIASTDPGG